MESIETSNADVSNRPVFIFPFHLAPFIRPPSYITCRNPTSINRRILPQGGMSCWARRPFLTQPFCLLFRISLSGTCRVEFCERFRNPGILSNSTLTLFFELAVIRFHSKLSTVPRWLTPLFTRNWKLASRSCRMPLTASLC